MRSQVVTKHQRISLMGFPSIRTCTFRDVVPLARKRQLRPQARIVVLAKRHVVMRMDFAVLVASRDKPVPNFRRKLLNGDLDVDHVLAPRPGTDVEPI